MKLIILALILIVFILTPQNSAQTHTISGLVKDFNDGTPLQGVTVALYSRLNQKILGGTSSNEKGAFNLKSNYKEKNIVLRFSYVGYETKQVDSIDFKNNKADLGTILLKPASIMKSAVQITGQKPMVEFYVDKQVINMDQVPGSQSGSVSEALRNTGIVEVDPSSSKISLRGNSNVNILIDGKPQPMADNLLAQMPASYIDKVEVITTPSAKDDPEGDAGIINIITKKEHHDNYNGTLAFYSATQQIGYLSSALNYRQGSLNLFGSANGYWGKFTKYNNGERINYLSDILHSQSSIGQNLTQGYMSNIKLGLDYDFDTLNLLSLTGNYNKTNGKMIISADNLIYDLSGAETYSYDTKDDGHGDFNNYNVSGDYKKKFNTKGHEISADAFFSTMVNSTHDLLTTQYNYLPLYPGLDQIFIVIANQAHGEVAISGFQSGIPLMILQSMKKRKLMTAEIKKKAYLNN
ncbi:MAG: carboxypeptidase-like regulatory domain-containing protein [Ignavibacteriaceae bacterium]|nr:carboxypeptidase-like regulatory domain-containing protein [Ignavibacteriaceae bacterium]